MNFENNEVVISEVINDNLEDDNDNIIIETTDIIEPLSIRICPLPKPSTFENKFGTKTFNEHFNYQILKHIVNNWDLFEPLCITYDNTENNKKYNPLEQLNKFLSLSKGRDYITVSYKKGETSKRDGRWFAKGAIGLQSLPRRIRHTISKGLWKDIDFKNCHPVILEQLCKEKKISCNYLTKYNNDRETMLKEIMEYTKCNRDDAKMNILKVLNGSNLNINVPWFGYLKEEFINIAYTLSTKPEYKRIRTNCLDSSRGDENIDARTMNKILCIYENECLEKLFNYLDDQNMITGGYFSLIFDGCMVADTPYNNMMMTPEFFIEASKYIYLKTGLKLDIVLKPFDEVLDISNDIENMLGEEPKNSYNRVKADFEKRNCKILNGAFFVNEDIYGDYIFNSKDKLITRCENIKCQVLNDKGRWETVPFIKRWLTDENMRTYTKLVCNPDNTEYDENTFNIWKGFRAEKLEAVNEENIEKLIEPIIYHLREIITGEEHLWFILSYLANIIQKPTLKTNVAILIKGLQGTGKDIIFDFFREKVLGDNCSSQNASIAELFDRFDNTCINKVFCLVDEVNIKDLIGDNNKNTEKFKDLITSSTLRYEEKGVMKTTLKNLVNLILTSNNENPIPIPFDDRRLSVFETQNTFKGNTKYFKELADHLKRDDVTRAFYQYLMKYDISNIDNFQNVRPITPYYNEMKRLNLPVFYRFLSHFTLNYEEYLNKTSLKDKDEDEDEDEDNIIINTDEKITGVIPASSFYLQYLNFIKFRNYTYSSNSTLFGRDLKKIYDKKPDIIYKKKSRGLIVYVISINKLKDYLKEMSLFDEDIF